MRYVKHYTQDEWNRFNQFVKKEINGETFYLDIQEMMCKKFEIIITDWQPKWNRRYNKVKKYVNQKNLDKSIKSFNKMVNSFSSGLGETTTTKRKSKKNHDILFGKSKSSTELWGKSKKLSIWGDKPKRESRSLNIWNDDKKTSIW